MVKLASARESRLYGPHSVENRWEYINAGLHVFAAALLTAGFSAELPSRSNAEVGLAVILVALALLAVVNAHDLVAHMAGIDYQFGLFGYDVQLGLVELAVPLLQMLGSIVTFTGILFLFIQEEKGFDYKMEKHAVNMLIAGPLLWVIGSIHNTCQIYERADGDTQILQSGVYVPFLMGSLLFFVAGIFNRQSLRGSTHREARITVRVRNHVVSPLLASFHHALGLYVQASSWAWLSTFGGLLFLVGGLTNVAKVFKMQQRDGLRLEKLRGSAQERLFRDREGRFPILENSRRRPGDEASTAAAPRG
ncbi:hypothetical protein BHE74_00057795 [Ensete ventricosum]|nr:hypothetical protein BHE74_00057795 [Ensete ventricosum]